MVKSGRYIYMIDDRNTLINMEKGNRDSISGADFETREAFSAIFLTWTKKLGLWKHVCSLKSNSGGAGAPLVQVSMNVSNRSNLFSCSSACKKSQYWPSADNYSYCKTARCKVQHPALPPPSPRGDSRGCKSLNTKAKKCGGRRYGSWSWPRFHEKEGERLICKVISSPCRRLEMTASPLKLSDQIFQRGRAGHGLGRMWAASHISNMLLGLIIRPLLHTGNMCVCV